MNITISKITTPLLMLALAALPGGARAEDSDYSIDENGAVADALYYRIGGGSVITPALTRRNTEVVN